MILCPTRQLSPFFREERIMKSSEAEFAFQDDSISQIAPHYASEIGINPAIVLGALAQNPLEQVFLSDAQEERLALIPGVVRKEQGTWHRFSRGIEVKFLSACKSSIVMRLKAGSSLPRHSHQDDEECLVLEGTMRFGGIYLDEQGYQCAPKGSDHKIVYAQTDALIYVRALPALKAPLTRIGNFIKTCLPGQREELITIQESDDGWDTYAEGIECKILYSTAYARSMLLRFTAGASLLDKTPSRRVECLILEGGAKVNNAMLYSGDYQCVEPSPSHPLELTTTTGTILFMRVQVA